MHLFFQRGLSTTCPWSLKDCIWKGTQLFSGQYSWAKWAWWVVRFFTSSSWISKWFSSNQSFVQSAVDAEYTDCISQTGKVNYGRKEWLWENRGERRGNISPKINLRFEARAQPLNPMVWRKANHVYRCRNTFPPSAVNRYFMWTRPGIKIFC